MTPGDGPQDFHLVLLDNGRTDVLADTVGRQALRCIRCSACLNICPVYERTGGHAYGSVYPGPIGAILTPQLHGMSSEVDKALPYASSLCGACYDVCPVAIDIPEVLVHLREQVAEGPGHSGEKAMMAGAGAVFGSAGALDAVQRAAGVVGGNIPRNLPGMAGKWTDTRDIPDVPKESFRQWWNKREQEEGQ